MNEKITIEAFDDKWAADFKRLNKAWLETYFEVELIDEEMLSNPRQYYIEKGGDIYLAVNEKGEAIGCYALIRADEASFEFSKMAVDSAYQGKGIGHLLMEHAIAIATKKGAKRLVLYSHTKLGAALHIYAKYGFVEIPVGQSVYKRSDIKMEKILTNQ